MILHGIPLSEELPNINKQITTFTKLFSLSCQLMEIQEYVTPKTGVRHNYSQKMFCESGQVLVRMALVCFRLTIMIS